MAVKPLKDTQDISSFCSNPESNSEIMASTSASTTSSSSRESGGSRNGKKKRKLVDHFERLMKQVLERQETLQNKFVEALERYESDRIAREEAWKVQELDRLKREQEMLAQERAISATRDAAVIAFLQKMSEQGTPLQLPPEVLTPNPSTQIPFPFPSSSQNPMTLMSTPPPPKRVASKLEKCNTENSGQSSSSRWPKPEIEALIVLKTNLDMNYKDTGGPRGPLWEEISLSMQKLGYNRNAKRCKEKWENINKYYKRMKESNRTRPSDSKTCPYYDLLDSIYERKNRNIDNSGCRLLKPEDILMQMQQQQQQPQQMTALVAQTGDSENVGQNHEDNGEEDEDEETNME